MPGVLEQADKHHSRPGFADSNEVNRIDKNDLKERLSDAMEDVVTHS
ncbi:MAG: hypothetical protein KZQ90_01530 [Candidatus Thiodiazotropha sp. (ex Codakia rugifera)]|nr:hypothetical protein [Candidatus Thiodiazotropha sp. (ex Codakia rugifera)]